MASKCSCCSGAYDFRQEKPSWTRYGGSEAVPRNYHSVANLLPDGRVFSGGGGLCGDCATNHADGSVFTPPYLLNADGSSKPRPAITGGVPPRAAAGTALTVTTGGPVASFVLMRAAAATHSTDNDQRRVPLTSAPAGTGAYTVSPPGRQGRGPAGHVHALRPGRPGGAQHRSLHHRH